MLPGRLRYSLIAIAASLAAQVVTDPGVITTRQTITPAGLQTVFSGRVYGVAFGSSSELWVLAGRQLHQIDWSANRVLSRTTLSGTPGLQGVAYDARSGRALLSVLRPGATSGSDRRPKARLIAAFGGPLEIVADNLGNYLAGAISIAPEPDSQGRRFAIVPLVADNKLAVVDLEGTGSPKLLNTGIAPFGAVINAAGTVAYVSNWGGRLPEAGELTARSGPDRVVVDRPGIAATGSVTRLDLVAGAATAQIPVGLHPTAILWDESRSRLYVANGNEDTVSVIDTAQDLVVQSIPLQPFPQTVRGIAPTALTLSSDGATLYVACGGINAVAVIDTASASISGLIPTAWYPNSLSLSADNQQLAIATLLGVGSGWTGNPARRYVHANRGTVHVVPVPAPAQLASYTTAVAENNHVSLLGRSRPARRRASAALPKPVPERSGDPSLIEHVVYIIKENRTYDQVFGDLPQGNGDPSLVLYGRRATPNHHNLAEQFVLLDNFYAVGGNSGDGHQWLTQANETDYCLWPGYTGRSYPFDGTDPIAYSAGGFIWDAALRMKKTVRVYGEYAGSAPERPAERLDLLRRWNEGHDFTNEWTFRAPIESLNAILAKNYPPYSLTIPDVIRAQIFLADLREWQAAGEMPNLTILQLPGDHTMGATPGTSTARAMMADNDYALGLIVEALTHTRFWPKMAIFVVEDDAQDGVDHVDGHRTVALAISPYTRRGAVDSTFYSQLSILKTIELILGLPALSLFDLIATDMSPAFQDTPDLTPYLAEWPGESLFQTTGALNALRGEEREAALASLRMRFDKPDAAPTARLNRILWHTERGWKTPYPGVKQSLFAPYSVDVDDDDREERELPANHRSQ